MQGYKCLRTTISETAWKLFEAKCQSLGCEEPDFLRTLLYHYLGCENSPLDAKLSNVEYNKRDKEKVTINIPKPIAGIIRSKASRSLFVLKAIQEKLERDSKVEEPHGNKGN